MTKYILGKGRTAAADLERPSVRSLRELFNGFIRSPILWIGYYLVKILLLLRDMHIGRFIFGF